MSTEVILTGTGYPRPHAERAGPGAMVRCGNCIPGATTSPRGSSKQGAPADERVLADEVRAGGYRGEIIVGRDLSRYRLRGAQSG